MSAPGSEFKDLPAVSSKVNPTAEVKYQAVEEIRLIRTSITAPITFGEGRHPYNPDAKQDHTVSSNDENLLVGVCQILGFKNAREEKNQVDKLQQDAYGVFQLKEGLFSKNYKLAEKLIFDVWSRVVNKFSNAESGGCGAEVAIFDAKTKRLFVSHSGDCRAYVIFRDPKTNKILLVTRLQSCFHKPDEPKESGRYKESDFEVDKYGNKRLLGEGGRQMNMTRSVGDKIYPVGRWPDLLTCDLSDVKDDCIVDILLTSDGVLDQVKPTAMEEKYIEDVLAKCDAEEPLAKQVTTLVEASLCRKGDDNQTAVMVRLTNGKSKSLPTPMSLESHASKTSLTILTDGHSKNGEVIAREFITAFRDDLNDSLVFYAKNSFVPSDTESKFDFEKEYKQVRLNGQQYGLGQQVVRNPTFWKENLKVAFYNTCGYILDLISIKVRIDESLGYKKVKEISYCTLNRWEVQKNAENQSDNYHYVTLGAAQLEIDFIYDKSGKFVNTQVLFSLPESVLSSLSEPARESLMQKIGYLSRIDNFNSVRETTLLRNTLPFGPNPAWSWSLNRRQIAEVEAAVSSELSEDKSQAKTTFLTAKWVDKPLIFCHYHSYLVYDGWLKSFFNAGNKLLHEQLIKYINNRFTMGRDNRLAWLFMLLETIAFTKNDTAHCWSSYANNNEYKTSLLNLMKLINSEIMFLANFQPDLPKDEKGVPVILKTQGDHTDNYPSWLEYHQKSAACCLLGTAAVTTGVPFIWNGIWAAITGPFTLFGGRGGQHVVSRLVGKQMDAQTQKLRENLNAITQSPTNSGVQEFKIEGITDKEDVIDQYVKAIADDADDALKQSILINNDILGQFAKMFEGKITQQRIADFKTILMDDVFERFIIENPEVAKDFNKILISNNNKKDYKTLVKQVNPKIYDILFPEITLNQGPLPGTVPIP